MVKLDILINGDRIDPLSVLLHREQAKHRARDLVSRMRKLIPRQMFDVAIQASIGSRVISRETVKGRCEKTLRQNAMVVILRGNANC
ncbi:MAG: hypothetical protein CM1200mP39_29540 [Dehalococcoidia bacterium]|nr:MAG: hypothetical protein CM1200mP39_29540 [Dehalococcoidia bacterium]